MVIGIRLCLAHKLLALDRLPDTIIHGKIPDRRECSEPCTARCRQGTLEFRELLAHVQPLDPLIPLMSAGFLHGRVASMNDDQLQGKWKQLMGIAKERWGKLTDDDWTMIGGKKDQLIEKTQERTATPEEAEKQPMTGLKSITSERNPR